MSLIKSVYKKYDFEVIKTFSEFNVLNTIMCNY